MSWLILIMNIMKLLITLLTQVVDPNLGVNDVLLTLIVQMNHWRMVPSITTITTTTTLIINNTTLNSKFKLNKVSDIEKYSKHFYFIIENSVNFDSFGSGSKVIDSCIVSDNFILSLQTRRLLQLQLSTTTIRGAGGEAGWRRSDW